MTELPVVAQERAKIILSNVQDILAEADIASELIPANVAFPIPALIAELSLDHQSNSRTLGFTLIPTEEDFPADFVLLQLYSEIQVSLDSEQYKDLATFLDRCNILQPIGHFGRKEDKVYFRHVLMIPKDEGARSDLILQTTMLFEYALDVYQEYIVEVAEGKLPLVDAIAVLSESSGSS